MRADRFFGVVLCLLPACASELAEPTGSLQQGVTNQPQRLAIPTYFYPGATWTQLLAGAPTVGLAIINPNSGAGASLDVNYQTQTARARAAGVTVLGYVYTGYGGRPATQVQGEIDRYYAWYGVDGIFLDEASTDCAVQPYYASLYSYIKAKGGVARVALNPGTTTTECYISSSDMLLTFEDTYVAYRSYAPAAWESRYPADRFWHLVHSTSASRLSSAISLSKSRHAGWVYVTPDKLPNPWDTLPPTSYFNNEIALAAAP